MNEARLSLSWREIDAELEALTGSRRISKYATTLAPYSLDDVRQLTAMHVLERMTKSPDFVKVLADPGLRRAYLFATLYNYARAISRKSLRRKDLLGQMQPRTLSPELDPSERADLYEIMASVLERVPLGGIARLAIDVITESTTLQEYAAAEGVSVRTAQRRFLAGMELLRELAKSQK